MHAPFSSRDPRAPPFPLARGSRADPPPLAHPTMQVRCCCVSHGALLEGAGSGMMPALRSLQKVCGLGQAAWCWGVEEGWRRSRSRHKASAWACSVLIKAWECRGHRPTTDLHRPFPPRHPHCLPPVPAPPSLPPLSPCPAGSQPHPRGPRHCL